MLHTVNKSPFEKDSLASCLRLSSPGHCILLIEDGVYGALANTALADRIAESLADRKVYALGPDLKARGIDPSRLVAGVEVTDYEGFVALAAECGPAQAWL